MRKVALLATMKNFTVEKVVQHSRLGSFHLDIAGGEGTTGEDGVDSLAFHTPMYFIHTQTGSVPHVTAEVLRLIYPLSPEGAGVTTNKSPPVQVSLDSTLKYAESLTKYKKGIGKFVGFGDLPVFLTMHDPLHTLRPGHNDKFGIALWSRHGRTTLTPNAFTDVLGNFKPALGQIISDYDVHPQTSGMKRLKKSLSRAQEYTSAVLEKQAGNFDGTGLFITVEASWFQMDEELAKKTVANLVESKHLIKGVTVAGLVNRFKPMQKTNTDSDNGNTKSKDNGKEFRDRMNICDTLDLELVDKVIQILPRDLPKYIPGPFHLTQMIDLMCRGFDIFDSSVTSRMADDAQVFILDQVEAILPSISKTGFALMWPNEDLSEREVTAGCEMSNKSDQEAVVTLKDKRFFDDFRPISNYCSCYTCRKHTRSYIHHLFATDELLGPVLIQVHNLTALDRFFKIMHGFLKESDTVECLNRKCDLIKKLFNVSDPPTSAEAEVGSAAGDVNVIAAK